MKRLLLILILALSFHTLVKADDIRDFEIEGMSIGDSLLDYFNKSLIDSEKTFPSWSSKKFTRFVFFENLKTYDGILIYFEDNGDYVISSISAIVRFQNNIDSCYKKKATIIKEFKNTFSNYELQSYKSDNKQDKTGKSKNDITDFNFSSGASSRVICTDWSNEMNLEDELRVILSSKEWTYFITNVAYK